MTGIGENTLAQPVKPPLRERHACLAKLVKNRLTLTQVFGHIKDEFFRGRTWPDFESFKADLDDFVVHWNTRRRQVKLKGLTPEEFRRQSLAA